MIAIPEAISRSAIVHRTSILQGHMHTCLIDVASVHKGTKYVMEVQGEAFL